MNHYRIVRCFSLLLALTVLPSLRAADAEAASPLTGHWEGSTHVIVAWCARTELPVSLDVRADGSVTGKIGDAELTDAHLKRKWNWFSRNDAHVSTHVIRGHLNGPIVAAEGITRREVFIHVRLEDAHLAGGLATNGSKIGGKESMILTTTSLRLSKS